MRCSYTPPMVLFCYSYGILMAFLWQSGGSLMALTNSFSKIPRRTENQATTPNPT